VPEQPVTAPAPRIPERCKPKVAEIERETAALLARLAEQKMELEQAEVRRIRDAHLPNLLRAYDAISPAQRSRIWLETGHSASFMLNDRLGAILAHVRQIAAAADARKIEDFHTELRFVDTRYASRDPFELE
jgi:hypothetical protein